MAIETSYSQSNAVVLLCHNSIKQSGDASFTLHRILQLTKLTDRKICEKKNKGFRIFFFVLTCNCLVCCLSKSCTKQNKNQTRNLGLDFMRKHWRLFLQSCLKQTHTHAHSGGSDREQNDTSPSTQRKQQHQQQPGWALPTWRESEEASSSRRRRLSQRCAELSAPRTAAAPTTKPPHLMRTSAAAAAATAW